MSDYYCKCKSCKHIDPTEKSGYKWYCTWYRSYEDPDCIRECVHYENNNGSGGCFLTSACCQYKGLPDNCDELTQLRAFRDTYLMGTEDGCNLVEKYYRIAPAIVEKVNVHTERDEIYAYIYATICEIIEMIKVVKFDDAVKKYERMVLSVQEKVNADICKEAVK